VLADAFSVIGQKRNWKDICEQFEQAAMADNTQAKSILNDMSRDLKIESSRRESTPLLIIDQAEELLVQCSEDRAASFFSLLSSALKEPNSSLMTIFSLRSDFLGEYQRQKGLLGLPCEHFPVGPMAPEYLPKIIEGPAAIAAIELEDGLTEAMVRDTENQDAIPLLAFALRELYEHCGDDKRLEVKEYREKLGGLSGAVSRTAESALNARQLSADQEQVLRNALVSLARINEEGQFTRQAVHWSDFPESVHDVLESFVQARLLISRGQEADRVLEVAHEKLFHSWEKLRNWLFEDEEFLLWKRRFGLLLGEWQHTGKNKSALLRGPSLKEAQRWQRKRPKGISFHEHEFIKNSLKIAHRGKWIRRGFVGIVLLVLTLGAAIQQWTESKDFQVNSLLFSSPQYLPNAMFSTGVKFYQTLEIAGKIGDIGTLRSDFPVIKALRINSQWYRAHLLVLSYASRFLSNQGNTMQANDLVEKMLDVSNSLKDIQADPPALTSMSLALHAAGRVEEARGFANKALAAARAWPVYDYRFVIVGAVSHMFAKIGMSLEAEMVIKEALDALPRIENRPARINITNWVSIALVRLGRTEEAIANFSQGGDPTALPLFTQALVDEGRLEEAQSFAQKYQNAFSMVIVASAFASAGEADRSRMAVKEALYLLNQMPVSLITLRVRELLLSKVLLKIAKPREALLMIKELGDLNGLGLLASILAEAKERSLTREAAHEAIEAAHSAPELTAGSRAFSLAAKSLALIGDTDEALALIHEIEGEEFQTFALSNVAQGFAERGDLNRAEELLPELEERVAKITDQALKSLSWANTIKVRVYLGNYKVAAEADINTLSPNDLISVYETVLRKYEIERNPKLKKLFVEKTNTGLGVYGVQWP
jgi:tetratricopeptide (TPR) repeat protein